MRTDFIKAYCAVMKYQSVTKAADMIGTSQPAVSKMIAQFEHLVGFKLFRRVFFQHIYGIVCLPRLDKAGLLYSGIV